MHALITGGAGFIGSHLAEALLARGDDVTVIDDLSTGQAGNLEAAAVNPRLAFVHGSVLDADKLDPLIRDADVVYHLASAVGVRLIIDQPVGTIESIVEGTQRVLALAAQHRRRVLITSSSEVYGKAAKVPFSESDDTVLGPTTTRRWAYACGKMLDEFLALAHWHESRLPVVCVRLFNTVGPRQTGRYGMVVPTFVRQALAAEPVTVFGDGEQTRCFCHVADVVAGLVRLMDCDAATGQVINLGSDDEITINALAARVCELAESDSPIEHVPYDAAYVEGFEDMHRRVPDLSRARELIGFAPRHSLDDVIASVIAAERVGE